MPRPERALAAMDGPVARFAEALRELRRSAGNPGYRVLAGRAGYSSTTLSDAAGGRRLPALPVVLAYVQACGGDVEEWRGRWRQTTAELTDGGGGSPYLGLASFETADAHRFFGRAHLIAELLERLTDHRFLALCGASGSGKSSVLRAGVIAAAAGGTALAGRRWPVVLMTPGAHPATELAARLAAAHDSGDAPGNLLVVDQFEEVFTLCADPDERERFVARLVAEATAPDRDSRVLLGLRADFYATCARFPALVSALAGQTVLIGPLTEDELRQAVTGPAALAGLTVERALVTQLVADAHGRPGALPLLSHALLETWRHRQGSMLTLAGYEAAGGVRGAIAATAERVYGQLDPDRQRVVRQVLLRLTALGEGTEDTRRLVPRAELDLPGADSVIDELVAARLLVVRDDVVEIAHEALIAAWPRLRDWLTGDREGLRTHRMLTEAASAWLALARDDGALYRGARLALAREWSEDGGRLAELTPAERDFLAASLAAERAERAAVARRTRQRRAVTVVLAALLAVAVGAGTTAIWQWRITVGQRQQALADVLAAQALASTDLDLAEAMRLSLRAYHTAPTAQARSALLTLASRPLLTDRLSRGDEVTSVALAPDGGAVALSGQDGRVVVWDAAAHRRLAGWHRDDGPVRAATFTPDGRHLVSGAENGAVLVTELGYAGRPVRLFGFGARVDAVAVSPDGTRVAATGEDGRVLLWRLPDGSRLGELTGHGGDGAVLTFGPDGRSLVSAGADGTATVWDLSGRGAPRVLAAGSLPLYAAGFSPDGRTLALGGEGRQVSLWDVGTGARLGVLDGHDAPVRCLAFAGPSGPLVSAGYDGEVLTWDIPGHRQLARATEPAIGMCALRPGTPTVRPGPVWDGGGAPMLAHLDRFAGLVLAVARPVSALWDRWTGERIPTLTDRVGQGRPVAFQPTGGEVAVAGPDGVVRIWRGTGTDAPVTLPHPAPVALVAYSMDGRRLVAAGQDGTVSIWDSGHWTRAQVLHDDPGLISAAFSPEGDRVAVGHADGTVTLWDVATARPSGVLAGMNQPATAVAFSMGGRLLVTAGRLQPTRLWEVPDGRLWATLTGPDGVNAVAWSDTSGTLYTTVGTSQVATWLVDPADAARAICDYLANSFAGQPRPDCPARSPSP
jgi:WD40 repeat protein